jgi:serine/threonine-protein kinase
LTTQIPQPHQQSSSAANHLNSLKICPNCNHPNPHGTIKCEACYTPLSSKLSCPNCGTGIQSNSIYCDQCGFNLNSSTLSNEENNHQPVKTIFSSSYSPSNVSLLAGRYQIITMLGQGGFGKTYMAQDIQLPGHPQCVVKQMKLSFSDPSSLAVVNRLFNTEAEIIYKLNKYDKIPQLLAHFEEDNEFYLVQEFIDGHELTEEISPGKTFSESKVIQLLEEVLEILDVVHNHNIIHRDIKPSNLIRRKKDGKLVLIDFGAGKEIQIFNNLQVNNATVIIGTSGYAAPEQMRGNPKLNSDIYSLGITAIHAVTGIQPYELNQSYEGEFDWHDKANISLKLTKIIDKMVCYNFMQRYQSAKEVLKDLNVLTHRSKNNNILTNILKTVLISNKVQNQTGTRIIQNKSNVFTIEFNWIKVLCIILIIILAVLGWVKFTEKKSTHHDKLPRLEQK